MENIPKFEKPAKILVVQIGKLGDMILTTPLFRNLKRLYPDSKLTVLASERNSEIAQYHPAVDKVLVYKKSSLKTFQLLFYLKSHTFDIWIDPKKEKSKTSTFLLKYAKPGLSIGFNHDEPKPLFDIDLTPIQSGNHAVDINLSPLNAIDQGFTADSRLPDMGIPEIINNRISNRFMNTQGRKVFINLSAGMPARMWGTDNWLELLSKIEVNNGYNLIVNTHGADSTELNEMKNKLSNKIQWLDNLTPLELAAVIKNSDVVISPDTAAIHMASAFNIPVIDLMNNVDWNIERFAPLSEKQMILVSAETNSLKTLTPDSVYRAFEEKINS